MENSATMHTDTENNTSKMTEVDWFLKKCQSATQEKKSNSPYNH